MRKGKKWAASSEICVHSFGDSSLPKFLGIFLKGKSLSRTSLALTQKWLKHSDFCSKQQLREWSDWPNPSGFVGTPLVGMTLTQGVEDILVTLLLSVTGTKLPIKSPKMESSCDASFFWLGLWLKPLCLCKKELPLHNHFYEHNENWKVNLHFRRNHTGFAITMYLSGVLPSYNRKFCSQFRHLDAFTKLLCASL